MANIMRSVDELRSVAHSGTGRLEGDAISLSQGGLKIPRRKELVARGRKIMQGKIKPSRNCPFEYGVPFVSKLCIIYTSCTSFVILFEICMLAMCLKSAHL